MVGRPAAALPVDLALTVVTAHHTAIEAAGTEVVLV